MAHLLVAMAYLLFAVAVFAFERYRIHRAGVDAITIFAAVCMLQCCLAPLAVNALMPFVDSNEVTGVPIFDTILRQSDMTTMLLVLCMSIWFVVFFYIGCTLGRVMLPRLPSQTSHGRDLLVIVREKSLLVLLAAGFALTLYSFFKLGDSLLERYIGLIRFRGLIDDGARDLMVAEALSLTQTFSWLAVLIMFPIADRHGSRWLLLLLLTANVVLALMGVSRRAIFLPILLAYLAVVLNSGRWHLRWVAAAVIPLVFWVAFGEQIMAAVAYGGSDETIFAAADSWAKPLLRAASEVGITVIESLGTLQYIDLAPRFGVDHLLSIARKFPEQMMGLEFDFPPRIVRLSTEAFVGADMSDMPPGLVGQMWLDFRILGPAVWGIAMGLQMGVVQYFFERTRRTPESAAVFALAAFVVAYPINTGSYDFTFSIDMIVLAFLLMCCIRVKRLRSAEARGDGPALC
jgi:hypothetical protein